MQSLSILLFFNLFSISFSTESSSKKAYGEIVYEEIKDHPLLKIAGVSTVLEQCQKKPEVIDEKIRIDECVWNGLTPQQQEKAETIFSSLNDDKKTWESNKTLNLKRIKTKAELKLEAYLFKRLDESLSGKEKNKRLVRQKTFFELLKTQESKNIISSLSTFCLDADSDNLFYIHKDKTKRKRIRKKNLELASTIELINPQKPKAYNQWTQCAYSIKDICHATGDHTLENVEQMENVSEDDRKYTKRRACLVLSYIRAKKQGLLTTTKIIDHYDDLDATHVGITVREKEFYEYGNRNDERTIDEITSISSTELVESSGYRKALEKDIKTMNEKCFDGKKIVDEKYCEKYLSLDRKNAQKLLIKERLQLEGFQEKIKKITSKEDMKLYIEDAGYPDIDKILLEYDGDIEKYKKVLLKNYKHEKDALIEQLSLNVEELLANDKGKVLTKNDGNRKKLGKVLADYKNKADDSKELIHYNNIISSYLTLETTTSNDDGKAGSKETKEVEQNTTPLRLELTDLLAYKEKKEPSQEKESSEVEVRFQLDGKKLQNVVQETGVKLERKKGDSQEISVGIELIQSILD